MYIKPLFILIFTFTNFYSFALKSDSLTIINYKGKKYILHIVEKGETLYKIARHYALNISEVRQSNKFLKDSIVTEGLILKLPLTTTSPVLAPARNIKKEPVFHNVEQGQTLYAISKLYGPVSLDSVRKWNNFGKDTLKIGQQIIVGWNRGESLSKFQKSENSDQVVSHLEDKKIVSPKTSGSIPRNSMSEIKDTTSSKSTPVFSSKKEQDLHKLYIKAKESGQNEIREKGKVSWSPDNSEEKKNLYALHKSAPAGTVLKVKNLMNGKEVFVKVIGTLPPAGPNENLLLNISSYAAKQLEALDPKFIVEISYYIRN